MQRELLQVAEFMRSYQQPVRLSPVTELFNQEALLRFKLGIEEHEEFEDAFTFDSSGKVKVNRALALDALADKLYILLGDAHALGLGLYLPVAFELVHKSNMTKLWTTAEVDKANKAEAGGLIFSKLKLSGERRWLAKNALGKIIKSPSYQPADLQSMIDELDGQEVFDFNKVETVVLGDEYQKDDPDSLYEIVDSIEEDDSWD